VLLLNRDLAQSREATIVLRLLLQAAPV